jgi:hypothetical protein
MENTMTGKLAPIALWAKEEMAEACKYAATTNQMASFRQCLKRLRTIGGNYGSDCYVSVARDFAPHSFGFAICSLKDAKGLKATARKSRNIIGLIDTGRFTVTPHVVGGMIFHGSTKDEEVNNFTATFEERSGWSLHT